MVLEAAKAASRVRGAAGRSRGRLGIGIDIIIKGNFPSGTPGEFTDPTADWTQDSNLSLTGSFFKGAGWQIYKDATLALGATGSDIIEDASSITFRNTALARFCSLFDIILVDPFHTSGWPGLTPKFIYQVKSFANPNRENRPGIAPRCHFAFQGWKDDMPSGLVQSSLWNHYYTAFRDSDYFMLGTGPNTHGCNHVDLSEGDAWPGGPFCLPGGEPRPASGTHVWLLDYAKTGFPDFVVSLMRQQWDTYWTKGGANALPIDSYVPHDLNWFPNPGFGGVTNQPVISISVWERAVQEIFAKHQAAFAGLGTIENLWNGIGGLGGPDGDPFNANRRIVKGCKAVIYNFIFGQPNGLFKVTDDLERAAAHGALCCLGNEFIDASYLNMFTQDGHQDWWTILKTARAKDWEYNTYVTMRSVNTGARLFWHPAMRPVI